MSTAQAACGTDEMDWRVIDGELRKLAAQRGQLDANEAFLLCSAARQEIWRKAGRASFLEYLEEVLGYTPKCARERLRVATALDVVPELAEALATGEQSYSAIRELTRVVTPETQTAWRAAARGKNVRQIEQLVSVHAPGDQPTDPPRPDLKPHRLSFEVSPATFARLRQVQQILADEQGAQLDDDALIGSLCAAILDGGKGEADHGRARYQVMTTICAACLQGWQEGGGRQIAVTATDIEMVECDAQWIGSDREPSRAKQDIAPKVRRHVWHRDHRKCTVDGCRSARNLDVHHIVPRSLGGGHEAENLTLLCGGHHRSHHEGLLQIRGRAPELTMTWTVPLPHGGQEERSVFTKPTAIGETSVTRDLAIRTIPASTAHVGHDVSRTPETDVESRSHVGHAATRHGTSGAPASPGRSLKYERVVMKTEAIQALTTAGFHRSTARMLVDGALQTAPSDVTLERLVVMALQRSRTG